MKKIMFVSISIIILSFLIFKLNDQSNSEQNSIQENMEISQSENLLNNEIKIEGFTLNGEINDDGVMLGKIEETTEDVQLLDESQLEFSKPTWEETIQILDHLYFDESIDVSIFNYQNLEKDEIIPKSVKIIYGFMTFLGKNESNNEQYSPKLSSNEEFFLIPFDTIEEAVNESFDANVYKSQIGYLQPVIVTLEEEPYLQYPVDGQYLEKTFYTNIIDYTWSTENKELVVQFEVYQENSVYYYRGAAKYRKNDGLDGPYSLVNFELLEDVYPADETKYVTRVEIIEKGIYSYERVEEIANEKVQLISMEEEPVEEKMIGETDDYIVLQGQDWNGTAVVEIRSKENLALLDSAEFDMDEWRLTKFRWYNKQLIYIGMGQLSVYSEDLELIRQTALPEVILKSMANSDEFVGIDINKTLDTYLYSDINGLYLYHTNSEPSVELITEPRNYYWNSRKSYLYYPSFVGEKENIMATIFTYESDGAKFFYDREEQEEKYFDFGGDDISFMYSQSDYVSITGSHIYEDENNLNQYNGTVMFNFTNLNYYSQYGGKNWSGGYLVNGISYDGVTTSAYAHNQVNTHGPDGPFDYIVIFKYDIVSRTFSQSNLVIPTRGLVHIIGVTKEDKVIVQVSEGKEVKWYYY